MKTLTPLVLLQATVISLAIAATAQADDAIDIGAGFDIGSNNSYFTIADNTDYNFTNIVITATDTQDGFTDASWTISDVSANSSAVDYFNGTQAFQSNFPATYAYSIYPGDITYQVSGDLNGQFVQTNSFSTDSNLSGGSVAFLGLDSFGNATNTSDYATVASAAVPLPGAFYLFASSLIGLGFAGRKKPTA